MGRFLVLLMVRVQEMHGWGAAGARVGTPPRWSRKLTLAGCALVQKTSVAGRVESIWLLTKNTFPATASDLKKPEVSRVCGRPTTWENLCPALASDLIKPEIVTARFRPPRGPAVGKQ